MPESMINVSSKLDIEKDMTKKLVLDIDLGKAIIDESLDTEGADYNFSNKLELNAGLRLVD